MSLETPTTMYLTRQTGSRKQFDAMEFCKIVRARTPTIHQSHKYLHLDGKRPHLLSDDSSLMNRGRYFKEGDFSTEREALELAKNWFQSNKLKLNDDINHLDSSETYRGC